MFNSLFPQCPVNAETIAEKRQRLKELEIELVEYKENKGKSGFWYGRGFVGSTKREMTRIRQWLREVA